MRQIQLRASELGHRLFRNNSGVGWVGEQVRTRYSQLIMVHPGDVVIRQARALHAGLTPGSSDLIGLTSAGQFIACEVKAPKGRVAENQESFLEMVQRMNGLGIVAKTVEDFRV